MDCTSRRAIDLRIWLSGTSAKGSPGAGAGMGAGGTGRSGAGARAVAGAGTAAAGRAGRAVSRSRRTMRPSGPEPWTARRSSPCSCAIFRASGEALMRPDAGGAGAGAVDGGGAGGAGFCDACGAPLGATAAPALEPAPFPAAAGTVSPGWPMSATGDDTVTVCPAATVWRNSTPPTRATSSITALSVSTSASTSPTATVSPSCFFHSTRRPSSMVGESASITTWVAMATLGSSSVEHPPDGIHDLRRVDLGGLLEVLVVGHRYVGARDPEDRSVELIERLALDHVHHLRADTRERPPLFRHDAPVRPAHRPEQRGRVERPDRTEIQHFRAHALPGELLGGLERHGHRLRVADDGDVGAGALHVGPPQRNQVLAVRDLALQVVEHLAFDEDHRVVVPDGALEQPLGVRRRRRHHDLEARDVGVVALECLGVLGRQLEGGAAGPAEDGRH